VAQAAELPTFALLPVLAIHTIFEGTSEIQQLVIARAISGMRVE
jgi:alkylation response protein AidB-like acyl-CoA dehydrogenase